MKTFHINADILVKNLLELERQGLYDEAFEQLKCVWSDFSATPDVEDLEPGLAAEMLLRCGSLIGFFGHINQVPNSQEISKNLLTDAHNRFLSLFNFEKVAECENYIALAYWRKRENSEADTWIETSLFRNLANSNKIRLYSYIIKSVILHSDNKPKEIVSLLENLESDFVNFGDEVLKGDYYNNLGLAFRRLQCNTEASKNFEIAKYYHQNSGHRIYFATIENNLAMLYKEEQKFNDAHKSIDSAINIFRNIKDRTREGFSFDTKALIYFAEEKYQQALESINTAIRILEKGENKGYLVESYETKVKILVCSDKIADATVSLFEAYQIAKVYSGNTSAKKLLDNFELLIKERTSPKLKGIYSQKEVEEFNNNYELVFHKSIIIKNDFNGVRIKNNNLEKYGLKNGTLAITVKENIQKGDLVAVLEKENNLVACGFYDYGYGIICLDNEIQEPQLFNENEVELLGKVVGFCEVSERKGGKLLVKPIEI
jgi:tetratricopeptide (TPR) repeat protein